MRTALFGILAAACLAATPLTSKPANALALPAPCRDGCGGRRSERRAAKGLLRLSGTTAPWRRLGLLRGYYRPGGRTIGRCTTATGRRITATTGRTIGPAYYGYGYRRWRPYFRPVFYGGFTAFYGGWWLGGTDDRRKAGLRSPYEPFSSPSSPIRSTETTRSSSAVSNTITPCVERPAMRMPFDRAADELAAVGHQHDLVGLLDRERGDQPADLVRSSRALLAFPDRHRDDAFAAAAGDPVLVGRRALAVAALGNRQHELLGRRHLDIALLAELDRAAAASSASAATSSASSPSPRRTALARLR